MPATAVSVSEFKAHRESIRQAEHAKAAIDPTRRGKVVARTVPTAVSPEGTVPWHRLRRPAFRTQ